MKLLPTALRAMLVLTGSAVLLAADAAAPTSSRPLAVVKSEFIYETAPFPEAHASTIVETTKHELVASWFGGTKEKNPDVCIWVSRFDAGKNAWTAPVEVANGIQPGQAPKPDPKTGSTVLRYPTWNPVLFQPRGDAPLMLFYKVGPSPQEWWGEVRTSTDGGRTWSAARKLPNGILGPIKNKPVQLPDGTILSGVSVETPGKASKWQVHFERSSDGGKTWAATPPLNDGEKIAAIQPSILFLDRVGGVALQAIGRTKQDKLFTISSDDAGKTWGTMTLFDVPNPNSGTDAVTLRDGRQVLVCNPVKKLPKETDPVERAKGAKDRTPLVVMVSADAREWKQSVVLENEPGEYSYPAVIQASDGSIHITYTWKRKRIKHVVLNPLRLEREQPEIPTSTSRRE